MTASAPAVPAPGALRVVSYNIHGLRGDRSAVVRVVREIEPDILIIQEGPRRFRWRTRCAALADSVDLVYAAGGLPALGNVVLTGLRVRVREAWCLQYPLAPGHHLRGAVFVRCTVAGADFVVAGSHLSTDPGQRLVQAQLLAAALARLDRPVILGVDVNDIAGSDSWQLMVSCGLVDAAHAQGRAGQATYPARDPRQRIDVLLCHPALPVRSYHVPLGLDARQASDHLPVVAEIGLPTPQGAAGRPPQPGDPAGVA